MFLDDTHSPPPKVSVFGYFYIAIQNYFINLETLITIFKKIFVRDSVYCDLWQTPFLLVRFPLELKRDDWWVKTSLLKAKKYVLAYPMWFIDMLAAQSLKSNFLGFLVRWLDIKILILKLSLRCLSTLLAHLSVNMPLLSVWQSLLRQYFLWRFWSNNRTMSWPLKCAVS